LLANGFMQSPPAASYVFNEAKGRLELVNFFALIGNPKGWIFFWHTISDGLAMAAFLILAVSAYHIIRKQNLEFFKLSFQIASVVGLIASVLIFLGGHTMGQYMREVQPMKLAAIEAMWKTEQPASFSLLVDPHSWSDEFPRLQ
jgi:cytochrome d ubiquinol oxidase subunit I